MSISFDKTFRIVGESSRIIKSSLTAVGKSLTGAIFSEIVALDVPPYPSLTS